MNRATRRLLKRIAKEAGFRSDKTVDPRGFDRTIRIVHYPQQGDRFVDRDKQMFEGGSDLSYAYNTLNKCGLISVINVQVAQNQPAFRPDGIRITDAGLDEARGWLFRAIDQQPVSFLQVVVGAFNLLLGGLNLYLLLWAKK